MFEESINTIVCNDTNFVLNHFHAEALNLGLSFVPSPKPNRDRTTADMERYRRNINLRIHWGMARGLHYDKSIISSIIPSDWDPPNYITRQNPNWRRFLGAMETLLRLSDETGTTNSLPPSLPADTGFPVSSHSQQRDIPTPGYSRHPDFPDPGSSRQQDLPAPGSTRQQDLPNSRLHRQRVLPVPRRKTVTLNTGQPGPPRKYRAYNIDRRTEAAWKELTSHPDFYVLKADKGGKTVMWKKCDYRTEALRQLDDRDTYQELDQEEFKKRLQDVLKQKETLVRRLRGQGNISSTECNRLLGEEYRVPAFYLLPKIHKEKRPDTGSYPGRPIIAAIGSPLKSLDVYLAKLTSPLLPKIPGSLQDTSHLLRDLDKLPPLPERTVLFSADVESLYPSIPWDEGISAATKFYGLHYYRLKTEARNGDLLPPPSPRLFRDILKLILTKNYFHFQEYKWFHQLSGTAMGCSISVFLANTFLYYRTKELLDNPPADLLYLGRYIDDIIGIWTGEKEDIPSIFYHTVDDKIKLTYVLGDDRLEALDLEIQLRTPTPLGSTTTSRPGPTTTSKPGFLELGTKLYRKPTDGHLFVHWHSAHPQQLKRSIPYAQLLRLKRNCSEHKDYLEAAHSLLERFRNRGYPEPILQQALGKAARTDRHALINPKTTTRDRDERLTVTTDFLDMDLATRIKWQIRTVYDLLLLDPTITERTPYFGELLPKTHPRVAFRAGARLGSRLGPTYKYGDRLQPPSRTSTGT